MDKTHKSRSAISNKVQTCRGEKPRDARGKVLQVGFGGFLKELVKG